MIRLIIAGGRKQRIYEATHCVVFPGGSGTDSMFRYATWAKLTIYDWRKGVDDQRRLFGG